VNDPTAIPVVVPHSGRFSRTSTSSPFSLALTAAASPLPPPPMTMTPKSVFMASVAGILAW